MVQCYDLLSSSISNISTDLEFNLRYQPDFKCFAIFGRILFCPSLPNAILINVRVSIYDDIECLLLKFTLKLNQNIARRLLLYMEDLGHSPAAICQKAGVKYLDNLLDSHDFTGDELEQLWSVCEEMAKLDDIGFHFGQYLSIESLGTLGMLLQHVSKVSECIEAAANFIPLASDFVNITTEIGDRDFTISIIPDATFKHRFPMRTKQVCLLTVSLIIKMYWVLTMKKPRLTFVAMPEQVKNRKLTAFCYPHEIAFHPSHYIIKCSREVLELPIVFANARMKPAILELAQQEMKDNHKEWTAKVFDELGKHLDAPTPTLNDVSHTLGLSSRSLQRRLHDEESSFQDIATKFKTNLAKGLLSRSLSPKEVAIKLGYNNVSAFYKSFKQWTGQTVQDYINSK